MSTAYSKGHSFGDLWRVLISPIISAMVPGLSETVKRTYRKGGQNFFLILSPMSSQFPQPYTHIVSFVLQLNLMMQDTKKQGKQDNPPTDGSIPRIHISRLNCVLAFAIDSDSQHVQVEMQGVAVLSIRTC